MTDALTKARQFLAARKGITPETTRDVVGQPTPEQQETPTSEPEDDTTSPGARGDAPQHDELDDILAAGRRRRELTPQQKVERGIPLSADEMSRLIPDDLLEGW